MVACATLAFFISSTVIVSPKKRPTISMKMQKASFLIGIWIHENNVNDLAFNYELVLHRLCLICTLMFTIANFF